MKNILLFCFVLILSGCTTLADAREAKGTGMKRSYSASHEAVWNATLCSLKSHKLDIVSEEKQENTILAQRGMTAFSYGENIAVFVRKNSPKTTEVEVVSKKVMTTNVFAPDWSQDILQGVENCLEANR